MPNKNSKNTPKSKNSSPAPKKQVKQRNSSTMGSTGLSVRSMPAQTFSERRTYFNVSPGPSNMKGSIRVQGQDYMGSVTWNSATPLGAALLNNLLCPSVGAFANTRLQNFAKLYDKYCFKTLKFHTQTSNPSTAFGSYILAYDRDPTDQTPPQSEDGLRAYYAMDGSRSAANWESISITCPLADSQDFYYTNPVPGTDERLTYQGQLYVAVVQAFSGATNPALSLWVEYDLVLMDPQLELSVPEATATQTGSTTPNATGSGWNNTSIGLASSVAQRIVDAAGNVGYSVPQGTWLVEQAVAAGAANTINQPQCRNAEDLTTLAMTALSTAFNATGGAGNAYRLDKVTAGPQGAILNGNFTNAAGVNSLIMRIFPGTSGFV